MRNIKLTMEYDGSRYKGLQQSGKTPNSGTISEKILDVLRLMTGEEVELFCAARTETGVHAIEQAASFKTNCTLSLKEMNKYLNHYLPQDIVVLSVEEMPERFHAGLNVKTQTYLYRIQTGELCDIFRRRYTYYQKDIPCIEQIQKAVPSLIGKHDFSAFSSGKKKKGTEKELISIDIFKEGDEIQFLLKANSFLHQMPRSIIGTLLEIGYNKRPVECINKIFIREEPCSAPVPSHGLFLKKIEF
ncbi:MAG: tRNA pseudouridine(38-40) synthase TruA [Schaedlerella sp.]|nr:tRNA pseudouridine(38-40) synthase TruA [Schaedlerella sp.]